MCLYHACANYYSLVFSFIKNEREQILEGLETGPDSPVFCTPRALKLSTSYASAKFLSNMGMTATQMRKSVAYNVS